MQGKNVDRFPLNVGMTPDLNDELNDRTKGVDSCSAQTSKIRGGSWLGPGALLLLTLDKIF